MTTDKIKQYIAMVGGALGGVLLFLRSLEIELKHFNEVTIEAFVGMLVAFVPLMLIFYGVWKNTYLVTKIAKKQEDELKKKGLK